MPGRLPGRPITSTTPHVDLYQTKEAAWMTCSFYNLHVVLGHARVSCLAALHSAASIISIWIWTKLG